MAIPASYIVAINPRLISAGGTDLEFNGLLLTANTLVPMSSMVLEFTSADSVGSYFGEESDEYKLASNYFLGYDNSFAKPKRIMIGARVDEARAAYLRGAEYEGTLSALKAVTDGSLTVTVDGSELSATDIDLSEATSYSGVADIIQTALGDSVTVEYSSLTGGFVITSATTGADSTIEYPESTESGTDLAELLGLTSDAGAILSQGSDALEIAANMKAIKKESQNWVTFTTIEEADDDDILEYANWANDQGVDYLYVAWSSSSALTVQGSTTIAETLESAGVGATVLVYPDAQTAVFVMGAIASIDWERLNGTITLAFKAQDGIGANVTDEEDADVLKSRKVSYIGEFATRNDSFVWLYDSQMFGDYGYVDTYINAIWLKNVMQVSIMEGLGAAGRVPYNERGYALIRAWLQDPINRALKNGCIDTGVELSESQKAQVYSEAGLDISTELWTNGYYIQIEDAGASVRTNRESPNVSVWYTYGGSVHAIEVASSMLI